MLNMIQAICSSLPEKYIISIRMELGASWVELETPEEIKSFGADTTEQAVNTALHIALDSYKEKSYV